MSRITLDSSPWPKVQMRDICTLHYGKALTASKRKPGVVPVYGSNGITGWHDTSLRSGRTVILGRKGQGPLGVEWRDGPFWVIDTAYYTTFDRRMDPRFFYYFVDLMGLNHLKDGTSNPSLTREVFGIQEIPLPSISEQRAIASTLEAIDNKIEMNVSAAATLDEMARAIYRSWFVNFDPVRAKRAGTTPLHMDASTATLFPNRFGKDGLPEGWNRVKAESLISTTKGRSYKSTELAPSDTALITLKSFARGGGYRTDGLKPYTGPFNQEQIVRPGELILSMTDVTQAAEVIGRATVARSSPKYRQLVASLDVAILRPKIEHVPSTEFFHQVFSSPEFIEHARAYTTGTTVLHLASEAVPSFIITLPPINVLEVFQNHAGKLREQMLLLEHENATLGDLRETLLPKLMSGEIRVRDAEAAVAEVA
jgi:type I restriction enzyme S subunit